MAKQRLVVNQGHVDEFHVFDANDPDPVSLVHFATRGEAEAWIAAREAKRKKANANRRERDQAMRDLGMTKTRYGWE